MKLSGRLLACAGLVQRGNIAADVGTDHGHLAIYLVEQGICPHVYASDLREKPLAAAKRNVAAAGIGEHITFCLSDGLNNVPVAQIQTVICAGMGGDNIIGILSAAPAVFSERYQLIFQPQSAVNELRRWLSVHGFFIVQEKLARDGNFVYTVMEARYGAGVPLSPGQQFLPEVLLKSGDPLLPRYFARVKASVAMTVEGLHKAKELDPAVRDYYETALRELKEMEVAYGLGQ